MSRYWLHFAKGGDPNGEGLPEWPRFSPEADVYLEFGDEVRGGHDPVGEVCELLDR